MTPTRQDDLRYLLLDMMSATRPADTKKMAKLDDGDWQALRTMAVQHRLGPILHHQRHALGRNWVVPENAADEWAEAYRQSAMRSLRVRRALSRVDSLLNAASIPYAALKGSWLILHAYPHPALRPMRDIDIVVAPEHALQVFDLFEANDFVRRDKHVKPAEYALDYTKHLPALKCRKTRISVEIHTRVIEDPAVAVRPGSIGDTAALLARAERHGDIAFIPPTDTLLHLAVHAVYDHHFNNGPLVINDIALIARSSAIDWERFWAMAKVGNWTRGCVLLFAMVRRYDDRVALPDQAAMTPPPSADHLESALLLTLQNYDQRGIIASRSELVVAHSLLGRAALLWRLAFPAGHVRAALSGSPTATFWILVNYPRWLLVRVGHMLFDRPVDDVQTDIRRAGRIENWLQSTGK